MKKYKLLFSLFLTINRKDVIISNIKHSRKVENSMRNAKNLKNVNWRIRYPNRLENEKFILERKNWGFRLLYDVYLKGETPLLLGSCIVKETDKNVDCNCAGKCVNCKCKKVQYVVKEFVEKDSLLKKRMQDIQAFVTEALK